jgi:hypothetical protein
MPKGDVMVRLAQKLECSVMDFFADENDLLHKTDSTLDEDELDIIRVYRKLSRKEKHEFMSKIYWYENEMLKCEE